jgi:spore coat polysaccharide biosynthesis protein SpsF
MPMIVFLLRRLQGAKSGPVALATTDLREDDVLADLATAEDVPVYRGATADVVARYVGAATTFAFDSVCRITADCPFVGAELVDYCIDRLSGVADFDLASTKTRFPTGLDAEIYRAADMARLHKEGGLTASEREHLTLRFYRDAGTQRVRYIDPPAKWLAPNQHFTVDTREDYEFAVELAASFSTPTFPLSALVSAGINLTAARARKRRAS